MLKIITTVGTSLFTNFIKRNPQFERVYQELEGKPFSEKANYAVNIQKLSNAISDFVDSNSDASAEISSTLAYLKEAEVDIELYLVCSDTILSCIAGDLLQKNFMNPRIRIPNVTTIEHLNVNLKLEFEIGGLTNLVNHIYKLIKPKFDENKNRIEEDWLINITGGYKGVIPYLALIGQISNLEIFYSFEDTGEIIRIPQMPVQFDMTFAEEIYVLLSEPMYWTEERIRNDLLAHGFISQKKDTTVCKLTGLGQLFKQIVEEHAPFAKNVLGFTVELKLYEYYLQNFPEGYTNVLHSSQILNEGKRFLQPGGEIDILITKDKESVPGVEPIIIEVKSFWQMYELEKSKVKSQLEGKIQLLKERQIKPSKISYIVYSFGKYVNKYFVREQNLKLQNSIKEIEKLIGSNFPNTSFELKFLPIQLLANRKQNIYQKFLQTIFKNDQFHILENTQGDNNA